jgi:hypothetical protein
MNSHKNRSQQGIAPYGAQSAPRLNADVQRPDNDENYGKISTATVMARKIEKNIRATPRK